MSILSSLFKVIRGNKGIAKTLQQNLSYLTLFQVVNISVPLITYPHLIHAIGKELYGQIIFAQAVVSYLVILINFGINTLIVKDVSIQRNNRLELSKIVCSVYALKGTLFIFSFAVLIVILKLLPQSRGYEKLFYLSMWSALYEFLVPFWYFQGIEKMKYITFLNFLSRSVFMVLIFFLIKAPDDYLLLPVINGVGALIIGLSSLYIIIFRHKLSFVLVGFSRILQLAKEAFNLFVSDLSVKLFAGSNKVIVGGVLGYSELAYYDLADKIIHVFRVVPLGIVRDSIYPIVARTKNVKIIHNSGKIMGFYSLIVISFILIYATDIVHIMGGEEMSESIPLLMFGSIQIFTTHISNYHITVGLWSFGYNNHFRNIMIYSSLIYLLIYAILWSSNLISLYTILAVPILIDFYNIIHIYLIFKNYDFNAPDN